MSIAIVGAAESGLGEAPPGATPGDLMRLAALDALAEAGLETGDVDGLFAASMQLPMASLTLGEALGVEPRYTDSTQIGGSSPLAHLQHARAAIGAGLCSVAVVAYGSTQRSVGRAGASVQEVSPWEAPYDPPLPVAAYALAASRHMHEFGTTPEQLASVAVAARAWAATNPRAFKRDPLSVEDVLASPLVCDPLHLRDCCLVTDGGGALVVVSAERAASLPSAAPVHVVGVGVAHSHRHISAMPSLTTTAAVASGWAAFSEAGLVPADVVSAQLYDAFTITPILFLEDLGFCAKGEGGPLVESGATAPGGALPVNTNGGGLAYGHPGMYGLLLLVEAVRRVRGGDEVVLAHGNGGVLSSQATVLLGASPG
jgi:acetyl-CoA acetyltransferase